MPINLSGMPFDIQDWYSVYYGVVLQCLCGDKLVYPCFNAVDILCSGCSSKPTEDISQKR